jgi:hypothetical protein
MKAYGGVDVHTHAFSAVALMEANGELHAPAAIPLEKELPPHGTHWPGGWVGPRTGPHDLQKRIFLALLGLELGLLGRLAHSLSPYRLQYTRIYIYI